eukprot:TRINITY_DN67278_c1_g1_i7.p1 TRINITY_DN67278_c1_g1~~TRINITY_DN67278_c1_g1_i7.p1  ORF type:complete len:182 (-),score=31.92 TRINITY_DN67278_c1_g1_i7:166-711(-)
MSQADPQKLEDINQQIKQWDEDIRALRKDIAAEGDEAKKKELNKLLQYYITMATDASETRKNMSAQAGQQNGQGAGAGGVQTAYQQHYSAPSMTPAPGDATTSYPMQPFQAPPTLQGAAFPVPDMYQPVRYQSPTYSPNFSPPREIGPPPRQSSPPYQANYQSAPGPWVLGSNPANPYVTF